jgi:hypothetical protein
LLEVAGDLEHAATVPIAVHDVSRTGMLLVTEAQLEEGAVINFDIPNLPPLRARVVWHSGRFFGAEFDTPLTSSELRSVYGSSKVVWLDLGSPQKQRAEESVTFVTSSNAEPGAETPRLPVARRIQIVIGSSMMLWAMIAGLFAIVV